MTSDPSEMFQHLVETRRAVRMFDSDVEVPPEAIKRSLQRAVLSPNSSNLQLWEFYWIRDPGLREQMGELCLNQNAAKTARELVVVVSRRDLWRQRRAAVLESQIEYFKEAFGEPLTAGQQRVLLYWRRLVPLMYTSGFGIADLGKLLVAWIRGLGAPTPRQVTSRHMNISAHRSVALAAMTFMHSITAEGFDSCPMEGFDSRRLKRALSLPRRAQISMVIAVGKRTPKGVYGPRLRVPLESVVFEV
jgi:nitroreductase